ncbi:unnamed protein product [Lactuca virosa]|uniref:Uncharacterized protein n=1 Tax=Lactuca virosa TaxID=75947 RepID=A0AAU9PKP2_9ASTR|nr:unnamed protein product [Lactuca virosa]
MTFTTIKRLKIITLHFHHTEAPDFYLSIWFGIKDHHSPQSFDKWIFDSDVIVCLFEEKNPLLVGSQKRETYIFSTGLICKWGSILEQICQMSDELEHMTETIDSSLNRFGLMLEYLQADEINVNKGSKELTMNKQMERRYKI